MAKAKYSVEIKKGLVKEYEAGRGSYRSLAEKYGVGEKSAKDWVRRHREQGELGLRARFLNE